MFIDVAAFYACLGENPCSSLPHKCLHGIFESAFKKKCPNFSRREICT